LEGRGRYLAKRSILTTGQLLDRGAGSLSPKPAEGLGLRQWGGDFTPVCDSGSRATVRVPLAARSLAVVRDQPT